MLYHFEPLGEIGCGALLILTKIVEKKCKRNEVTGARVVSVVNDAITSYGAGCYFGDEELALQAKSWYFSNPSLRGILFPPPCQKGTVRGKRGEILRGTVLDLNYIVHIASIVRDMLARPSCGDMLMMVSCL